ncbi:DUF2059 domain-containing protein [Pseudomonas sp. CGJS7]|uniref:DUF2059 domain-containing protein n=1 Tax=Pseudomonas sp. CGJS7 TaxID=3109348 RepID=UPI0030097572
MSRCYRPHSLAALLSLALCAMPVFAKPPSDAQIDRLMRSMNYERMKSEMVAQMRGSSQTMAESMTGGQLNDAQRAELKRMMDKTMARVDQSLAWENIAPIYRKVYREVFEENEVQTMIEFYESPGGRAVLDKMPRAIGLTMQEMQPLMKNLFEQVRQDLQRETKQLQQANPPAPPAPPSPPDAARSKSP